MYGINPDIPAETVTQYTHNQELIMEALYKSAYQSEFDVAERQYIAASCNNRFPQDERQRAHCITETSRKQKSWSPDEIGAIAQLMPEEALTDLYPVVVAGMNFIDAQCDQYLRSLFVIENSVNPTVSSVNASNMVSNAVLNASEASRLTMAIVAQAFGLTAQLTSSLSSVYLFGGGQSNAIINLVRKMQQEYKATVYDRRDDIRSLPAAHSVIRGYLQLCLPVNIKASVANAIEIAPVLAAPARQQDRTAIAPNMTIPVMVPLWND